MPDIEIRSGLFPLGMDRIAGAAATGESERSLRSLVDGLAEGVCGQEAQVVRKSLLDLGLQRMVVRAVAGAPVGEIAQVAQGSKRTPGGRIGGRIRGRRYGIAFPELVEMGSFGTRVGNLPYRVPTQVLLDTEVPMLHVGVAEFGIQREQKKLVGVGGTRGALCVRLRNQDKTGENTSCC